jgi:hypothetical protein
MKDIVYCLVVTKTWEKHATHFLQESQVICLCATKVLFVFKHSLKSSLDFNFVILFNFLTQFESQMIGSLT